MIDALYDNRKMTIVSADGEPEEIYSGKELEIEFKRCVSRLHEMRSEDYVDSSRIYWYFIKRIVYTIYEFLRGKHEEK